MSLEKKMNEKKIKAVLFDLDGTLLPMDQDVFIKAYFGGIAAKLAPLGYDPKALVGAIWEGTNSMLQNNGERTNEELFWERFCKVIGKNARVDEPTFNDYYLNEFEAVRRVCGYSDAPRRIINNLHSSGIRTVLATNPIFPAVATRARIRWAGLTPNDFELYTTYENICYAKPKAK